jgi:TolB-like protein
LKKKFQFILVLSIILVSMNVYSFCEAAAARIAVLPFKINAEKDFAFLQDGIQDMLGSRLSRENKVFVIDKNTVNTAAKSFENFSGKSRALLIGGKLTADYIIYGSLTLLGDTGSIDAKITDITGKNEPTTIFKQISSIDQVIPEINKFATDINTIVFHRAAPQPFQPAQSAAPNQEFISRSNQDFVIMESNDQPQTFWKSKAFEHSIVGMDFGDVNNDGIKEIVCISNHAVYIYQNTNNSFKQIAKIAENRINGYIGVDVADINNNGTPEIFVSSLVQGKNKASSFVIEYDGSKYNTIIDRSPWYYRIVKPVTGKPVLMAQKQEYRRGDIYSSPISIMVSDGSKYFPEKMVIKAGLTNVFGIGYDDLEKNGQKSILAFNKDDYISVFNNPTRPSWTGTTKLGGNMSRFLIEPDDPTNEHPVPQYYPMRLRTADTDQDGEIEVITAANYDIANNMVRGFRSFTKSKIQALGWDSLGFKPLWTTRSLSGRISDFFIEDFDNDGVTERVIAVEATKKALFFSEPQSHIIAYELAKRK